MVLSFPSLFLIQLQLRKGGVTLFGDIFFFIILLLLSQKWSFLLRTRNVVVKFQNSQLLFEHAAHNLNYIYFLLLSSTKNGKGKGREKVLDECLIFQVHLLQSVSFQCCQFLIPSCCHIDKYKQVSVTHCIPCIRSSGLIFSLEVSAQRIWFLCLLTAWLLVSLICFAFLMKLSLGTVQAG